MSEEKQATLDKAHKALDRLIKLTEKERVDACNEGDTDTRDRLERIGAFLRLARAEAGGLQMTGGVQPRSGGK